MTPYERAANGNFTDTVCECNHWHEEHDAGDGICFAPNCTCGGFRYSPADNTPLAIASRGGSHQGHCLCALCTNTTEDMSTTNESAIQADATMRYGAPTIYECGICGAYHPWTFNGDCRDDSNRGYPDEFAQRWGINEFDIRIVSMEERVDADANTTEDN